MSNRPNLIGSKQLYKSANVLNITNTQVAAIDSAISTENIYPNAYTAIISEDFDERIISPLATDVVIAASQKVAFGLFLSPYLGNQQCITNFKLAVKCHNIDDQLSSIAMYPFVGRCNASTVTVSVAAQANILNNHIILPNSAVPVSIFSGGVLNRCNYDGDIIVMNNADTNPICYGFVIENTLAAPLKLIGLRAAMSVRKYISDVDVFATNAR